MFAIVSIAGQQFKVTNNSYVYVHRLPQEEGATIELKDVLLTANGDSISVGKPFVSGASVKATVLAHVKSDKVIVFKKKKRKGYQKSNGHRQYMTKIQINSIS